VEQSRTAECRFECGQATADRGLAEAQGPAGGAQRTIPRHRKKDAGIVPVEPARGRRPAPVAAELLVRDYRLTGRNCDTVLYRHVSILSSFENKIYRYLRLEKKALDGKPACPP